MATSKRRKKARAAYGSKAKFVLSMPPDMPAKDVVAAAVEKGIKITDKTVYRARSAAKRSGIAGAPFAGAARQKRGPRGGVLEASLRRVIAELGLKESRRILSEVESAFAGR